MHSSSPVRRDAARNRAALLAAARELFEREGLDVPLERIAGTAGLSRASLARHFADRHLLIAAIWEDDVARIERLSRAVVDSPDGLLQVFDAMLHEQVDRRAVHPTTAQLLNGDLQALADRVADAVGLVLPASVAAGCVRPEVSVSDVLLAIEMGATVITGPKERPLRESRWRDVRRLILPALLTTDWLTSHPRVLADTGASTRLA